MPTLPRLAVAVVASATLTVLLAAQPAAAALQPSTQPVLQTAVHRAAPAAARLSPAQARAILIRAARHHNLNPNFVLDNAELGAALLRSYLTQLRDPKLALAAYYQGLTGVRRYGIYPSSRPYVDGIWRLRNRFQATHLGA
ncbi:MAG: lytic transglycosylase domain-containing protein [Chloroflexi bacterium]|nr:MAG: lytic transglycosylase domain-containing protein [Chloroflexota bacterium]